MALEWLEDRLAPAVISWDGGGGDFRWENPLNWSNDALPSAADDVQISTPGITVTHSSGDDSVSTLTSQAALWISGGTLAVEGASTIHDALTMTNGATLTGSGDITIDGQLDWESGTISGPGTQLALLGNAAISFGSLRGRTLVSAATATITGRLGLYDGAVLDNQGTLVLGNTGSVWRGAGDASDVLLLNRGSVTKPAGAGEASLLLPIDSDGPISLGAGELDLGDHFAATDSTFRGPVTGAPGTLYWLTGGGGALTFEGAFEVGRVHHYSGTAFAFHGPYRSQQTITTQAVSITGPVLGLGELVIQGGSVDFNGAAITLADLTVAGGTLRAGDVTVTHQFSSSSGTLGGSGSTTITAGAALQEEGLTLRDGRSFDNYGTASGLGAIGLLDRGSFTNYGSYQFGGTNLGVYRVSGTGSFTNLGTLTLVDSSAHGFTVPFDNHGTVHVLTQASGNGLALDAGGTSTGSFVVAATATIRFGGLTTLAPSSSLQGDSTLLFDGGTALVAGAYQVGPAGSTTVQGGAQVDFAGPSPQPGGTLVVGPFGGGTADFHGTAILVDYLTLADGTLRAGDVTVAGQLTWGGGTLAGSGTTTVEAGATLLNQGIITLDGRPLDNYGSGSGLGIHLLNGAAFTNRGSYRMEYDLPGGVVGVQGAGTFTNYGTLTLAGRSAHLFTVPFNNSGAVEVLAGAGDLALDGGGTSAGSFLVASTAALRFGGVTTLGPSSSIQSDGALLFDGSSSRTLRIQLSGPNPGTGFPQITTTGPVVLAGGFQLDLVNGFTPSLNAVFKIIDNQGVDVQGQSRPVQGTFAGLPEGAVLAVNGNQFRISYAGGDGNDVTLTAFEVALLPASLSGLVFADFNNDGQVDFGERAIPDVLVTLDGTDDLGQPVHLTRTTDADGIYVFDNLRPGTYSITETQPDGYTQGVNTVGTAGGSVMGDSFVGITLASGQNGLNYNFGERPPSTGGVQRGQTATIGFWNNRNGQALIKALPVVTNADGSVTSVANWLAATLPNIFGRNAANDLTGQSNAAVAALFQADFLLKGVKLDAQVLATALSVYATNATLDPTRVAAQYGFTVSGDGAGTATVNVGSNGDAFGVADNTTMTVMDLLLATNNQAVSGLLYYGNATKRAHANSVYSAVNNAGDVG
jgi:hypothetical protein